MGMPGLMVAANRRKGRCDVGTAGQSGTGFGSVSHPASRPLFMCIATVYHRRRWTSSTRCRPRRQKLLCCLPFHQNPGKKSNGYAPRPAREFARIPPFHTLHTGAVNYWLRRSAWHGGDAAPGRHIVAAPCNESAKRTFHDFRLAPSSTPLIPLIHGKGHQAEASFSPRVKLLFVFRATRLTRRGPHGMDLVG